MELSGAGEYYLLQWIEMEQKRIDLDLTKKVSNLVNIPVIASGGVGEFRTIYIKGIKIGKANAVLAAYIFHFGEHSILEAKQYLDAKVYLLDLIMSDIIEKLVRTIRSRKKVDVKYLIIFFVIQGR
jgi:cyclase